MSFSVVRSGSSFTGSLLSASEDTKYVFEPFKFNRLEQSGSPLDVEQFLQLLYTGDPVTTITKNIAQFV